MTPVAQSEGIVIQQDAQKNIHVIIDPAQIPNAQIQRRKTEVLIQLPKDASQAKGSNSQVMLSKTLKDSGVVDMSETEQGTAITIHSAQVYLRVKQGNTPATSTQTAATTTPQTTASSTPTPMAPVPTTASVPSTPASETPVSISQANAPASSSSGKRSPILRLSQSPKSVSKPVLSRIPSFKLPALKVAAKPVAQPTSHIQTASKPVAASTPQRVATLPTAIKSKTHSPIKIATEPAKTITKPTAPLSAAVAPHIKASPTPEEETSLFGGENESTSPATPTMSPETTLAETTSIAEEPISEDVHPETIPNLGSSDTNLPLSKVLKAEGDTPVSSKGTWVRMVLSLGVVLLMILGTVKWLTPKLQKRFPTWFAAKTTGGKKPYSGVTGSEGGLQQFIQAQAQAGIPSEHFQIVASVPMGDGRELHLLEAKGHSLIIASTPDSFQLLANLDDTDEGILKKFHLEEETAEGDEPENLPENEDPGFERVYQKYVASDEDYTDVLDPQTDRAYASHSVIVLEDYEDQYSSV